MGKPKPPEPDFPAELKVPFARDVIDSDLIPVEHNDCAKNEIYPPTPPIDEWKIR